MVRNPENIVKAFEKGVKINTAKPLFGIETATGDVL